VNLESVIILSLLSGFTLENGIHSPLQHQTVSGWHPPQHRSADGGTDGMALQADQILGVFGDPLLRGLSVLSEALHDGLSHLQLKGSKLGRLSMVETLTFSLFGLQPCDCDPIADGGVLFWGHQWSSPLSLTLQRGRDSSFRRRLIFHLPLEGLALFFDPADLLSL